MMIYMVVTYFGSDVIRPQCQNRPLWHLAFCIVASLFVAPNTLALTFVASNTLAPTFVAPNTLAPTFVASVEVASSYFEIW